MTVTEEEMHDLLGRSRTYTLMVLRAGPNIADDQTPSIVWEHGRRNLDAMKAGQMPVICAVDDDTEMCGVGVFDLEPEQVRAWMDDDPGVRAGVFEYELHVTRSFPGSTLPA